MIKYKCYEEGLEVIIREESYTSKCSFLDIESIKKNEKYLGKRYGKIFKSDKYGSMDSDVNGSLNILRKEFGNDIFNKIKLSKYKKSPKYLDLKLS